VLIQVEHLSHTYAPKTPLARTALDCIDIEITPGQRIGLVGATGSGKSTLVQHIAGLFKPTSGQVLLDGIPAHHSSKIARERRRRVGLAFQYPEDQIFERTVFREVAFGLGPGTQRASARRSDDQLRARVHWALEQVGLDPATMAPRSPLTLSGGEMRRVALASIICAQPEVLILDEPTAGLDPEGQQTLLASIQSWNRQAPGLTLIVISHNLAHLSLLVDRVIVLARGRIAAAGPVREILTNLDLLDSVGLEPPLPAALLHKLHQAGWPVRTDCLTPQQAADEIARVYRLGANT
jgi:energy-coupling factor transport system ATP-binding protein